MLEHSLKCNSSDSVLGAVVTHRRSCVTFHVLHSITVFILNTDKCIIVVYMSVILQMFPFFFAVGVPYFETLNAAAMWK